MNTVSHISSQSPPTFQKLQIKIWSALRDPKALLILLPLHLIVWLLMMALPQQIGPEPAASSNREALWLAELPIWLQAIGPQLYQLGFAQLFHSLWFWLPTALLLLHSLIALSDYAGSTYQRFSETTADLGWQHPLARRAEVQVRLSDTPDDFIAGRFDIMNRRGFHLQNAAGEDQRATSAILRRWAWWGPVVFYSGVVLLIGAFLASSFWFKRDQVRLFSSDPIFNHNLAGSLQLQPAQAGGSTYEVRYQPGDLDRPVRNFSLRPYRPIWLRGAIVVPTAIDRLLNIEVKDGSGQVLELTQLQEVLDQTERLTIPVSQLNDPLLFSIVSSDLALQISPEPLDDDRLYTLQVRQGVTGKLLNDVQVRVNEPITIETYTGLLSDSYAADVIVWHDPAWWLYPLAGLLILVGAVSTLFFPPVVVWLMPEIKGRGGQLFGIVETFGRERRLKRFLTDLLPPDEPSGEAE